MSEELTPFRRYANHKLTLARRLGAGECGGDYSDSAIIIAAVVSGIAADLWPGPGKDRRRFVQVWVTYADPKLSPARISVPLLVRKLRKSNRVAEAEIIEQLRPKVFAPGYSDLVVTGNEVDATEEEILSACPALNLRTLRDRSYPVVFYEHVRSALVHEYHLDTRSASKPMTERSAGVSYVNVLTDSGSPQRRIHYHLEWLLDVARSIATTVEPDLGKRPLPIPKSWWLDPDTAT